MLAVALLCASCLKSEDDGLAYDDVAVTGFTLGSANCYRTVKSSTGEDSTYFFRYSAAGTPVYIDQVARRIYNVDSLAVGTDMKRVMTSVTTRNGGVVLLKNLDDENFSFYSSSDSIDLSQKRTLRVVSNDGNHYADYSLDIVCHNEFADEFSWKRLDADSRLGMFVEMEAAQAGGVMYVLGTDANGSATLLRTTDGAAWTEGTLPVSAGMAAASMAAVGDGLALLAGGNVYFSEDGTAWTAATEAAVLKTIVGGTDSEMYGLSYANAIMVSRDGGQTWAQDDMESGEYTDNSKYLPAMDVSVILAKSKINSEVAHVTLVANKAYTGGGDDYANAVVWNKVLDPGERQPWTFTNVAWNNYAFRLPRMEGLTAAAYDNGIIAMGGKPVKGEGAAFAKLYYSPDQGATWHTSTTMVVPEGVGTMQNAVLVTDANGVIYLIGSNPDAAQEADKCVVWRGLQNRLLWGLK